MVSFVASGSIFLMICFITLSSGAPVSLEEDMPLVVAREEEGDEYGDKIPQEVLNELHIWGDKPLNNSADIEAFSPVPVDTNLNCPSCLPDALLSGRPRW